jgi:hypothetical protein
VENLKVKIRKFVEIFYDPERCNWHAVIEQELKQLGIERGKVTVICRPLNSDKDLIAKQAAEMFQISSKKSAVRREL